MTDAVARGPAPRRDLPQGLRAPGRPRRDRGAAEHPDARPGGAQADRVRLRARAAPGLPRRVGEARRPTSCPTVWAAHRAALARLDITEVPDLYLTQFPITNAAAIGSERPMVVVNSRTVELLDEARAAHRARPRGGPHPLRPRALPDRADDPALGDGLGRMPMLAGLPLLAVKMALLEWFRAAELSRRPRRDARQPRPARDLPDADGARRRRRVAQARPRRVRRARPAPTRSGSRAGTSSRACGSSSARPTRSPSSASRS